DAGVESVLSVAEAHLSWSPWGGRVRSRIGVGLEVVASEIPYHIWDGLRPSQRGYEQYPGAADVTDKRSSPQDVTSSWTDPKGPICSKKSSLTRPKDCPRASPFEAPSRSLSGK